MLEYCEREDKPFTFVPHQQVESENLFLKIIVLTVREEDKQFTVRLVPLDSQ